MSIFRVFFSEIKVNGVKMPLPKPQAMKEAIASPVGELLLHDATGR